MTRVGMTSDLPPGTVTRSEGYAVGNNGTGKDDKIFAVTRRCRHLGGPLDEGKVDDNGCLVCPWHQAAYDVSNGQMVRGPQGVFAKVPGLGALFKALTKVRPLGRGTVTVKGGEVYVD